MIQETQQQQPGSKKLPWHSFFMPFFSTVAAVPGRIAGSFRGSTAPKQKQARPLSVEQEFYRRHGIEPSMTLGIADKVENGFIIFTCTASLIFFTLILGYGNGFFFSGMREFVLAFSWTGMMYLGGFLLETTGTSALITAKRAHGRNHKKFVWGMFAFFFLAIISAVAQYILYKAQIDHGVIDLPQNALNRIPIFSFLLGDSTTEWFIWGRAITFHAAILIATLLIPTRKIDIEGTKRQIQEVAEADASIERAKRTAQNEEVMHQTMMEMWQIYSEGFKRVMRENTVKVVESTAIHMPQSNHHDAEADEDIAPKW